MNRSLRKIFFWLVYLCAAIGVVLLINSVDIAFHTCVPVRHVDAALILGSTVHHGEPSPIFKARLTTAADLFHKGIVSSLVVSGGITSDGELSEGEAGGRYLRVLGVPADRISQETAARSTRENLLLGSREIVKRGGQTWLVVSDRFHLRRAELLARELGIPFSCVAVPDRGVSDLPFLLSEGRKVLFMRILWLIGKVSGG